MKYGKIIVFGGSSGIGLATSEYLNDKCDELITLSRRPSPYGKWIETDITNPSAIENMLLLMNIHLRIVLTKIYKMF